MRTEDDRLAELEARNTRELELVASRRRNTRELAFLTWSRQRTIAYPWHICAAYNDNWCPFADYISSATLARRYGKRSPVRRWEP